MLNLRSARRFIVLSFTKFLHDLEFRHPTNIPPSQSYSNSASLKTNGGNNARTNVISARFVGIANFRLAKLQKDPSATRIPNGTRIRSENALLHRAAGTEITAVRFAFYPTYPR